MLYLDGDCRGLGLNHSKWAPAENILCTVFILELMVALTNCFSGTSAHGASAPAFILRAFRLKYRDLQQVFAGTLLLTQQLW